MQKQTISVIVITYNQEYLIKEALDSILSQRVDANLEILVADDCSTDRTASVVKALQEEHPGKITLLESQTNLGHTRNYARAWAQAKGDYIAHCDGDDYWTDPLKLAKQLEFLETHPGFSACANKINVICEGVVLEESVPHTDKQVITTEDLLEACYPHNSSLFFRNRLFQTFPDFFFGLTGHDWCISILNSLHGPIRILPETLSIWRSRRDGLWGGRETEFHLEHTQLFLGKMMDFIPKSYKTTVRKYRIRNYFQLSDHCLRSHNPSKARFYFSKLQDWDSLRFLNWRAVASLGARIYCLPLYNFLRQMRNLTLGEPPVA